MALYEDLSKVVLSILIERTVELQDLAVFEIRIDDIQILIRAKYESTKLTKFEARRKTLLNLKPFVISSRQSSKREYCFNALSSSPP